jgi:hypothetical protein
MALHDMLDELCTRRNCALAMGLREWEMAVALRSILWSRVALLLLAGRPSRILSIDRI